MQFRDTGEMPAPGATVEVERTSGVETSFDVTVGPLAELRLQVLPWSIGTMKFGLEAAVGMAAYSGTQASWGCRSQWNMIQGGRSALLVAPGIDVRVVFGEGEEKGGGSFSNGNWVPELFRGPQDTIALLSPGVDVAWRYAFSPAFATVLGARLAGTLSLGGREATGRQTARDLRAVGGLLAGVRF